MAEHEERLEGRVAQILNTRELVINIGKAVGVTHGMKFAVLSAQPIEIRDPESNEVLDSIDREKTRVEAREVRDSITICSTYRTKEIRQKTLMDYLSEAAIPASLGRSRPPTEVPESLSIQDVDTPLPLSEDESYVKRGDRVVQL